jgi:hypothetical protein
MNEWGRGSAIERTCASSPDGIRSYERARSCLQRPDRD